MRKLFYYIKKNNIVTTSILLFIATIIAFVFNKIIPNDSTDIALTYSLALVFIARFTEGYRCGIVAAFFCVVCVNFFFTYPHFELNFTLTGYPITFLAMMAITVSTSTLTSNIKKQAKILTKREKQLMEADKEKMRANLLRAVSHDLRTPLTSIIGSTSSLIENNEISDEEKKDIVNHIYNDSNWLLNMIENILSVTRIQNDTTKVKKTSEAVEEVISEAVTRLKKRLPEACIQVCIPNEFLMIPMDAMLIEQVIINLLENAVIHSKSTLPIQLKIIADKNVVSFHVIDYGIGIEPSKLNTIFDGLPSNEGCSADSQRGMGIGLSICKTIILAHDGTISAYNHEKGVEFIFTLPMEEERNTKNG